MSKQNLTFTFLGTGTSQGIPVIGCNCKVCTSEDAKDKRLRSSLLIESEQTTVLIDVGPDVRQQLLRANVKKLDAIVITHEHMDHVAGLDEIRPFNYQMNKAMRVFATQRVQERLKEQYSYIFTENKYPGAPSVELHTISNTPFSVDDIPFQPIEVMHGQLPIFGYRIGDFTYITDANYVSEAEKEKIKGSKYLTLNALREEKHHSHFSLNEALALARQLKPDHTYFTHISHHLDKHLLIKRDLPGGVSIAYDELKVTLFAK